MDNLLERIAAKKAELDRLRHEPDARLGNLEHVHDLELTYTSNAIEGNTLSAAETALIIEKGITVGGKPLRDHLEAIDHYDAIRYVRAWRANPGRLPNPLCANCIISLCSARSPPSPAAMPIRHDMC